MKILRFSVGFGKALSAYAARGPDRTEWVIAAIPLGGYVKMLDEREGAVDAGGRGRVRSTTRAWARASSSCSPGPLANFLLAIALYWVLFVAGMPGDKPVVGDPPARYAARPWRALANGDMVRLDRRGVGRTRGTTCAGCC